MASKRARSGSSERERTRPRSDEREIRDLKDRLHTLEGRVDRRSDRETDLTRRIEALERGEADIERLTRRVLELERQQNPEAERLLTRFSLADPMSVAPYRVYSELRDLNETVQRQETFLLSQFSEGEAGRVLPALQAPQAQQVQAPQAQQGQAPQAQHVQATPARQRAQIRPPELVYENISIAARPFAVWKNIAGQRLIFCVSCNDGTCAYSTIGPFIRHCQSEYHRFFLEFDPPRVTDTTGPLKEKTKATYKWQSANWDEATEAYQQYTGAHGSLAYD